MFTPLEYSTVGMSEEQAVEKYGEDKIEVKLWEINKEGEDKIEVKSVGDKQRV